MLKALGTFLSNLQKSLGSSIKIMILSKPQFSIKPRKREKAFIILGTGPSFQETLKHDQSALANNDLIGLNHFAEKEEFVKLKPKYYIVGAPEMWDESLNEYYTSKGLAFFNALNENTQWPLELFLANDAKKSSRLKIIENNKNITIHFYNNTPIEGLDFFSHQLFHLKLGMPRPHNVMIPSIMIGIWLGYKKIVLTGADHSWHELLRIDSQNKVELDQKHYFDKKENWRTMKYAGKRDRKMHEVFEKWMLAFRGYVDINEYAKKKKVKIYNASYKSYIDAFERKPLTEL
ncbi:MAG: hypothetical protein HKO66_02915 [Saprospiraceae bacterium]|nr:hypothetical protein [Bacteroidia bacterium]NNE13520.1 hypothetical protein [Saprospiraceae bacterium]NNL91166.1 hypothetical protein [Saprospiraceae bacterium]